MRLSHFSFHLPYKMPATQAGNLIFLTPCYMWTVELSFSSLCYNERYTNRHLNFKLMYMYLPFYSGADPGFLLGGGALVSCSTSTPINHIVFFLQNTSCIRKPQVISGGGGVRTPCTLPLDPPLLLSFWVSVTCQPTFTLVKHFNYLPLVSFQTNQESIVPNASTPTSAFLASWK